MNVLLFGATGMIGRGVLRECLLDPGVERVVTVGRSPTGVTHPKLRDIVYNDLPNFAPIEALLAGFDGCFFCLGITSAGMSEADYARVTYDLTMAAAKVLVRLNPEMTFVFVSGAGADSTEHGRLMWARIKGKTENALLRMPFKAAYMFRPGVVQPMHGVRSRTAAYRVLYSLTAPLIPLLRRMFPNQILTTEEMGRAMLNAVRRGAPTRVLESRDIHQLAASG
jgi:uncharacterized protein YbjT (DUF2867 family)